jgi:hypothetical protein
VEAVLARESEFQRELPKTRVGEIDDSALLAGEVEPSHAARP